MKLCKLTSPGQLGQPRTMDRGGCQCTSGLSVFYSYRFKFHFCLLWVLVVLSQAPPITSAGVLQVPLRYRHIHHDVDFLDDTFQFRERREVNDTPSPVPAHSPGGNLRGRPGQGYYITVYIGSPPQEINVLVDTGSSNFAVAAYPDPLVTTYFHRENSSTLEELGMIVNVPYTQGNWQGPLVKDMVTLSILPNVSVPAQVALITESEGFFINASNWQGILGLAYAKIARPDSSVEPYLDSLIKSAQVEDVFSMQFCGTVTNPGSNDLAMGGTMIIGGVDESLYEGPVFTSPIYREWYYEVIITDVEVDGQSLVMDCKEYNFDKTIVDSGTTNLRLPVKVYNKVVERIKEKVRLSDLNTVPSPEFWNGDDNLCWSKANSPYAYFPTVSLSLAHTHHSVFRLTLSAQQYLRPVGGVSHQAKDEDCFKFAISNSDSGTVLGAVVMEAFYTVFNRKNKTIGFAMSRCSVRDTSSVTSTISGPSFYKGNTTECAYVKPVRDNYTLVIVAYVMGGVCALCILPLILLAVQSRLRQCKRCGNKSVDDDDHDERPLHEDNR